MHYRSLRPTVEVPVSLAATTRRQGIPSVDVCTESLYALQPIRPPRCNYNGSARCPNRPGCKDTKAGNPQCWFCTASFSFSTLRVSYKLVNIEIRLPKF